MHQIKLIEIGDSLGFILPPEMLARLKTENGDTVFLSETPDGFVITPHDPAIGTPTDS